MKKKTFERGTRGGRSSLAEEAFAGGSGDGRKQNENLGGKKKKKTSIATNSRPTATNCDRRPRTRIQPSTPLLARGQREEKNRASFVGPTLPRNIVAPRPQKVVQNKKTFEAWSPQVGVSLSLSLDLDKEEIPLSFLSLIPRGRWRLARSAEEDGRGRGRATEAKAAHEAAVDTKAEATAAARDRPTTSTGDRGGAAASDLDPPEEEEASSLRCPSSRSKEGNTRGTASFSAPLPAPLEGKTSTPKEKKKQENDVFFCLSCLSLILSLPPSFSRGKKEGPRRELNTGPPLYSIERGLLSNTLKRYHTTRPRGRLNDVCTRSCALFQVFFEQAKREAREETSGAACEWYSQPSPLPASTVSHFYRVPIAFPVLLKSLSSPLFGARGCLFFFFFFFPSPSGERERERKREKVLTFPTMAFNADDVDGESPSSSTAAPPPRATPAETEAAALPRAPPPASFLSRPVTRQVKTDCFFFPDCQCRSTSFEKRLIKTQNLKTFPVPGPPSCRRPGGRLRRGPAESPGRRRR